MVFFTCNSCGESLKKSQVEKHYKFKCRSCEVLTCVDCHKDFPGDSYMQHTKCITEDEKYSAKGWQPKASANKGEKKQLEWIANLQALMSEKSDANLSPDVRQLLDTIVQHENIPRKKAKFCNFVKNIVRGIRPSVIDETWDIFEQALKPKEKSPEKAKSEAESEQTEEESRQGVKMFKGKAKLDEEPKECLNALENGKKKSKKRKQDEEEAAPVKKSKIEKENSNDDSLNDSLSPQGKFNWEETVEALLKKKGEMKVNKLRKKVIAEYYSFHEGSSVRTEEFLAAKLNKKLKKNKRFKLLKDVVSLSKNH